MKIEAPSDKRQLKLEQHACDLAVAGGGLSGVCCAITAARAGLKVVLVQDRPVLGGNASSEVRLWVLGATSHMGNNNRWAREGGVIDELLVENLFRNPEGNALIFDTILLEKVAHEPNITLLLNTAVYDLDKTGPDTIRALRAFCSQNETLYEVAAPLFCDATGDGVVGFLAGAAFRVGAEGHAEFGEGFAPAEPRHELLGHSMYFFSKDTGRPVQFIPPEFALQDITQIPRWRDIKAGDYGCRFWWLEWGGALDTIHDSEKIKWELWRVVYGVWNHIKNSGQFPEAATMTLEWVGTIPGKRESRRFEGDYMLTQQDLIEQRRHADAVSFGGWAIDLHPVEGVYSPQSGCTQWHSKGVYQIPYRCLYSRNVANLFLGGRLMSATHVAFGSTRVMCTCAHNGQAVGIAAALCRRQGLTPRALGAEPHIAGLQRELLRAGQFIPEVALADATDLAKSAALSASSEFKLATLPSSGAMLPLAQSWAMMLPVQPGPLPLVTFTLDVAQATTLRAELRVSSKPRNHTPDTTLAVLEVPLQPGAGQAVSLAFDQSLGNHGQDGRATPGSTGVPPVKATATGHGQDGRATQSVMIDQPRYAFVCLMANDAIAAHLSAVRATGVLAISQKFNRAVAKTPRQEPPPGIGIESFEFWIPQRRPEGQNLALQLHPPLACFGAAQAVNGKQRPTRQPNAWLAALDDPRPALTLSWKTPQTVARIELAFDPDFDHAMESVLMGHPERVTPFCVRRFTLRDAADRVLAACAENHQARVIIKLAEPVSTDRLTLELVAPDANVPAALFEIRCYST